MDVFDKDLHVFMEAQGVTQMFFSYRWFLLNFKREFDLPAVLKLWEILWSRCLTPHFHVFIALSILITYRAPLLSGHLSENDILEVSVLCLCACLSLVLTRCPRAVCQRVGNADGHRRDHQNGQGLCLVLVCMPTSLLTNAKHRA